MKKVLSLFSILFILLAFNSCEKGDPAYIYGWDDPADISGPRMLSKVIANNQTVEEYTPNVGNLWRIVRNVYNGSSIQDHQTIYLTYLGNKLTQAEVNGNIPGNTNSGRAVLTPNYNTAGRLVSLMNDYYEGNNHKKHSITVYLYDNVGRVINAYQKTATVNPATPNVYVYPNIVNDVITYDGNNVAKVESNKMVIDPSTGLIQSEMKTTYTYSGFDWRINPYTTILDNYQIIISSIFPEMYVNLSDNNPGKLKLEVGSAAAVESTYSYSYDTHNYPTNNGFRKFTYQPAP